MGAGRARQHWAGWETLHPGPVPALPPPRPPGWACWELPWLRVPSCCVGTTPRTVPGSQLPRGTFYPCSRLGVAGTAQGHISGPPISSVPQQASREPGQAVPQGGRALPVWLVWWDACLQGSPGTTFLRPVLGSRGCGLPASPSQGGVRVCVRVFSHVCREYRPIYLPGAARALPPLLARSYPGRGLQGHFCSAPCHGRRAWLCVSKKGTPSPSEEVGWVRGGLRCRGGRALQRLCHRPEWAGHSPEVPSESGRGDPVSPWQSCLARTPVQVPDGPPPICVWTLPMVLIDCV